MTKILLISCSINNIFVISKTSINKIYVIYIFIIYEFLTKNAGINTEIVGYVILLITLLSIDIILNIHFTLIGLHNIIMLIYSTNTDFANKYNHSLYLHIVS